ILPEQPESLPPARRRRQQRRILPPGSEGLSQRLEELAERVTSSFDFILFSVLTGLVAGIAILLDAPALYLLAVLVAPFMAPVVGLALASVVGSLRFLLQALGSVLIGSLLVFGASSLVGAFAAGVPDLILQQAIYHVRFAWADWLVLLLGMAVTTYILVRTPGGRTFASVALAYTIYLPVAAAGFGLTSGVPGLWPGGLLLFVLHLVWAVLIGVLVLLILGLRPISPYGFILGGGFALVCVGALALLALGGGMSGIGISQAPTITLTPTLTPTPVPPTLTPSLTATITLTSSMTPTSSRTPTNTLTVTPTATPITMEVNGGESGGVRVRENPSIDAASLAVLDNGTRVFVLDQVVQVGGQTWVRIRFAARDGVLREGWVIQSLLVPLNVTKTP
ncbi:MAG TPA: DUF389 domain-containing protein, partial [Anaerolineaceae bacterium]|nr:DUF389 domain-containing protein [Anaerolineaceae bacterium]